MFSLSYNHALQFNIFSSLAMKSIKFIKNIIINNIIWIIYWITESSDMFNVINKKIDICTFTSLKSYNFYFSRCIKFEPWLHIETYCRVYCNSSCISYLCTTLNNFCQLKTPEKWTFHYDINTKSKANECVTLIILLSWLGDKNIWVEYCALIQNCIRDWPENLLNIPFPSNSIFAAPLVKAVNEIDKFFYLQCLLVFLFSFFLQTCKWKLLIACQLINKCELMQM